MINKFKSKLLTFYENHYHKFNGDKWFGIFEAKLSMNSCNNEIKFLSETKFAFNHLVGTKGKGILFFKDNKCFQVYCGIEVYGLSYSMTLGRWFAFEKQKLHGRLISFVFEDGKLSDLKLHLYGMSKGIHQILFIDDILYICDTYNNSLLWQVEYNVTAKYWKDAVQQSFPNGKLSNGRLSSNYNHFNSVFYDEAYIYLLAHNETIKTGKKSEVYKLDRINLSVVEIITLSGSNCHNIGFWNDATVYCSSLEFEIAVGQKRIKVPGFSRGISASKDWALFGFSPFQKKREFRDKGKAGIVVYDKNLEFFGQVILENAQVLEIRSIDNFDVFHTNRNA